MLTCNPSIGLVEVRRTGCSRSELAKKKENKTSPCGIIDFQDCRFPSPEVPGLRVGVEREIHSGFLQGPRLVERPI